MRTEIRECAFAIGHEVLTGLRAPVLSRRFQKAIAGGSQPVKVNVGSGNVYLDGWINTDATWRSQMFLDLTKPWPVPAESIDRIYGDNVIEHFPLPVCRIVLRHCWDALRVGGALRLATPDVERTARAYLDDPELTAAHLERHRRHGFPADYPVDMLRITYAYHGHHLGYCFDWVALSAELAAAGFADIRRYEAGQSDDPVFQGLEHRQEPSEAATGLVVEAHKTGRPAATWPDRSLDDEDGSGRSSGQTPPSGSRPQRR
jgi:predicted SAM-dependent methyltransferase